MKAKQQSDEAASREIQKAYKIVVKDMRLDENSPTKGIIWDFKQAHEKGW